MALHQQSSSSFFPEDQKPRGEQDNWLALGKVVYGWTDRRQADVDRDWWRTAGTRFYWTVVKQASAQNESSIENVAEDIPSFALPPQQDQARLQA